jgi:hypothetical protein
MKRILRARFLNYTRTQCSAAYGSRYTYVYMCIKIRVFHCMCVRVHASVCALTQTCKHRHTTSKWMHLKTAFLRIKQEYGVIPSPNACFRIQQSGVYFQQNQGQWPSTLGPLQLPVLTDLSNHQVLMAASHGARKENRGLKKMYPRKCMLSLTLASVYFHKTVLTQNCN